VKQIVVILSTGTKVVLRASMFSYSTDGKLHVYSKADGAEPALVGTFQASHVVGVYDHSAHIQMAG